MYELTEICMFFFRIDQIRIQMEAITIPMTTAARTIVRDKDPLLTPAQVETVTRPVVKSNLWMPSVFYIRLGALQFVYVIARNSR